jgi:flagellar biosynthetic protein FliQ
VNETDIFDFFTATMTAVLIASSPILGLALLAGLLIAFFQALTQVQEMTLTFVPKIVVIFIVSIFAMPFMYTTIKALADSGFDAIASGDL